MAGYIYNDPCHSIFADELDGLIGFFFRQKKLAGHDHRDFSIVVRHKVSSH